MTSKKKKKLGGFTLPHFKLTKPQCVTGAKIDEYISKTK